MKYLRVRDWERWQSYRRDRGQPPWIKIHRELLRNPKWVRLTDAQRGQLVSIWILAADNDGVIEDPDLVQKFCFMSGEPDLDLFISLGFLEHDGETQEVGHHNDAKTTPRRRQDDEPEESREVEGKKEAEGDRAPDAIVPLHPDEEQIRNTGTPGPALEMAMLLRERILERDPKAKTPRNIEPWVMEFQRLNLQDGREWEEVEATLEWAMADVEFWQASIHDAVGFRKHYPKIFAQTKRQKSTGPDGRSAANRRAMNNVLKEFGYEESDEGPGGDSGDFQRADERGSDQGLSDGPLQIPGG